MNSSHQTVDMSAVTFQKEGSLVTRNGEIFLITAKIIGDEQVKYYILLSPDLKTLIDKSQSLLRIYYNYHTVQAATLPKSTCLQHISGAQKDLLKDGGIIIHVHDQDMYSNSRNDESVMILKSLGFPAKYKFFVESNDPSLLTSLNSAGFMSGSLFKAVPQLTP